MLQRKLQKKIEYSLYIIIIAVISLSWFKSSTMITVVTIICIGILIYIQFVVNQIFSDISFMYEGKINISASEGAREDVSINTIDKKLVYKGYAGTFSYSTVYEYRLENETVFLRALHKTMDEQGDEENILIDNGRIQQENINRVFNSNRFTNPEEKTAELEEEIEWFESKDTKGNALVIFGEEIRTREKILNHLDSD